MLAAQERRDEALAVYQRAVELEPENARQLANLGGLLGECYRPAEAIEILERAVAADPGSADARNHLGNRLREQGRAAEAAAAYRAALVADPASAMAHSNLLYTMNADTEVSAQEIFEESRRWDAAHGVAAATVAHQMERDPERRLRLGYVSPDLRSHSVSRFLEPLLAGHDHERFELFAYAQVANPDDVTRRFEGLVDHWCSTVGMSDEALAARVRDDEIHILVDLAGHTGNSRLAAFARHPAPVQVSWLGYPNTTGLAAMDYRLTDAIADPDDGPGDDLHSETLIRLPHGFLCFAPERDGPPVADGAGDPVTFGSFNNLAKITPKVVAAWARILIAVPESRLVLKNRSLADDETRSRYLALFAGHGIENERLDLVAWIDSPSGHLGAYEQIDIGLDPFPYNGTTTTAEALWMGVPVITLRGNRHGGRVGASLLAAVGQTELIAETVDDYVAAAAALAQDSDRLAALRQTLRPAMAASPLCDAEGFTRDVEAAYRDMWRGWCGA